MKKNKISTSKYTPPTIFTLVAIIIFIVAGSSNATPTDNNSTIAPKASTISSSSKSNLINQLKQIPDDKRIAQNAFRQWANEAKPFGATLLLSMFVAVVGLGFFPKIMEVSQNAIRTSFWRCLGRAFLTNVCLLILFRVFIGAKATIPLSVLLVGIYELLLLSGLAVSICLFGNQIARRTGIQNISFVKSRPKLGQLISILIGSILIALLVQIPELGKLPPIGIRLAVLIAAVGEGGLLVHLFSNPKS